MGLRFDLQAHNMPVLFSLIFGGLKITVKVSILSFDETSIAHTFSLFVECF